MENSHYSVFVYGTLQPGEKYHDPYCGGFVVDAYPAIAYGELYHLPVGYPAMTVGDRPIQGYCLIFDNPQVLVRLDGLEGYVPGRSPHENEYQRELTEIFTLDLSRTGTAWIYRMVTERAIAQGGKIYPTSPWTGRV